MGARIEEARRRSGLSRAELARRAGLSERQLRRMAHVEAKRGPSTDTVLRIADVLAVPCGWLIRGEGPSPFATSEVA